MFQLHWVCPHSWCVFLHGLHFSGSRLLCQELSEAGPGLCALPRSKPLRSRFSGTPQDADLVGPAFCALPRSEQLRWPGAWQAQSPLGGAVHLIASPIPATQFSGCTMGAPSQVCLASLLGSWSLASTFPVDVDHPESQEVLVSNESCLHCGRGCLSGATIAPFRLWLPPTCLSLVGDGPVYSQLALLSPLFCVQAWQCLRLGLFTG